MSEVYKAVAAVMAHMAKEGISKDRRNQQQGYSFRGIDDVYSALGKVMADNQLVIFPRVIDQNREERRTAKGGLLIYTLLTVEFDLVSAKDGSMHTVRMVGEAMDSADKSSNKAQSAALKYAALQVFMIPTEGDNDADLTSHEIEPRQVEKPEPRQKLVGKYTSKTALWAAVKQFDREVRSCGDIDQFEAFMNEKDTKDLLMQVMRDAGNVWSGGEGLPAEFVPLEMLIQQTRDSFDVLAGDKIPY